MQVNLLMGEDFFRVNMFAALRNHPSYATASDSERTGIITGILNTAGAEWSDFRSEDKLGNFFPGLIAAIKVQMGIANKTDAGRVAGWIEDMVSVVKIVFFTLPPP